MQQDYNEPSALFAAPSEHSSAARPWVADTAAYASDTAGVRPLPAALDALHCIELDAPTDRLAHYTRGRAGHVAGLEARPRPVLPGYETPVTGMVLAALLLLALCSRHMGTTVSEMWTDLTRVRTRSVFAGAHTRSGRVMAALLAVLFVGEGALLQACSGVPALAGWPTHVTMALLTGAAGAYYCAQWLAIACAGRIFTAPAMAWQWVRGLEASQMLMTPAVIIAALGALFRPEWTGAMLGIAAAAYCLMRILFICKGFRIFYTNFTSLVYFILYLCTLEIAPILLIWRAAHSTLC